MLTMTLELQSGLPALCARAAWYSGTLRTHLPRHRPVTLLEAEEAPISSASSFPAGPATSSASQVGLSQDFLGKVLIRGSHRVHSEGEWAPLTLGTRVLSHCLGRPPLWVSFSFFFFFNPHPKKLFFTSSRERGKEGTERQQGRWGAERETERH